MFNSNPCFINDNFFFSPLHFLTLMLYLLQQALLNGFHFQLKTFLSNQHKYQKVDRLQLSYILFIAVVVQLKDTCLQSVSNNNSAF